MSVNCMIEIQCKSISVVTLDAQVCSSHNKNIQLVMFFTLRLLIDVCLLLEIENLTLCFRVMAVVLVLGIKNGVSICEFFRLKDILCFFSRVMF